MPLVRRITGDLALPLQFLRPISVPEEMPRWTQGNLACKVLAGLHAIGCT